MIEHVPLLDILYNLYQQPRDMARFQAYLDTLLNDQKDDADLLPLVLANPMGREHLVEMIGQMLAFDAESIAKQALEEAWRDLNIPFTGYRHGLTVADDVKGGWTQRTITDFNQRFQIVVPAKRAWVITALWAGDDRPTPERIRQAVLMSIYRIHHIREHGQALTLKAMLFQEGMASRYAGVQTTLDHEDLTYTQSIVDEYLMTDDYSIIIAALYGDQSARALGYSPLGLSPNAGLELAIYLFSGS